MAAAAQAAAAAVPIERRRKPMKLTETRPDQHGVILKIGGDAHFIKRITAIGITEGTE